MSKLRTSFAFVALSLAATSFSAANVCAPADNGAPAILGSGTVSNTGHEVFRGVFSPNELEFFFFRSLGPNENYGIFRSKKSNSGDWNEAERVIIGANHSDLYPTLSPNGDEMVFVSYRPVSSDTQEKPSANIWSSRFENGMWNKPMLLNTLSNFLNYDNRPLFRSNGDIGFSSTSPDWSTTHEYIAERRGSDYEAPRLEAAREQFREWAASEPSRFVWTSDLSPDGSTAVIEVSQVLANGRPGPSDLWISNKDQTGWSEPTPLNSAINTEDGTENFPTFSADGKTLVFVRDFKSFYTVRLTCN